jgi:hypothetical protein
MSQDEAIMHRQFPLLPLRPRLRAFQLGLDQALDVHHLAMRFDARASMAPFRM